MRKLTGASFRCGCRANCNLKPSLTSSKVDEVQIEGKDEDF